MTVHIAIKKNIHLHSFSSSQTHSNTFHTLEKVQLCTVLLPTTDQMVSNALSTESLNTAIAAFFPSTVDFALPFMPHFRCSTLSGRSLLNIEIVNFDANETKSSLRRISLLSKVWDIGKGLNVPENGHLLEKFRNV